MGCNPPRRSEACRGGRLLSRLLEQRSAKAVSPCRRGAGAQGQRGPLPPRINKSKQPLCPADATAGLGLEIDLRSFCSSTAGPLADAGAWTRGRNDAGLRGSGRRGLLTAEKGASSRDGRPLPTPPATATQPPPPHRTVAEPTGLAEGRRETLSLTRRRGGEGRGQAERPLLSPALY